jgi:hypothetical protein
VRERVHDLTTPASHPQHRCQHRCRARTAPPSIALRQEDTDHPAPQQERDLAQVELVEREDGERQQRQRPCPGGGAAELPDGQQDHGEHGRLDSQQEALTRGKAAEAQVGPRKREREQRGGCDETDPCQPQPERATAAHAGMDHHLRRIRAWNQVGGAQQVEELFTRHPAPAPDDFLLEHRDMDRGSAEGSAAQAQHQERQFAQCRTARAVAAFG